MQNLQLKKKKQRKNYLNVNFLLKLGGLSILIFFIMKKYL